MCLQEKPMSRQEHSRGPRPAPPGPPGKCTGLSQTQSSQGAPARAGWAAAHHRRFPCKSGCRDKSASEFLFHWHWVAGAGAGPAIALRLSCMSGPEVRPLNGVQAGRVLIAFQC